MFFPHIHATGGTDSMNSVMLSENRPVFFGAYPSRIPARTQAPREDGTVSQEQAGNAVSLCCQTVTDGMYCRGQGGFRGKPGDSPYASG